MLAQRTDEILGQLVALIDIAADLADKALLALGLGLGLDVVLVIGIGHGILVADDASLGDGADEHAVRAEIHIFLDL